MENSARLRWRFDPQQVFANVEARRLYQSFVWSVWLLLVTLPPLLMTPIIAGQNGGVDLSPIPVSGLAVGCLIIAIILARWIMRGFDLRERRAQMQAAVLFAVPVILFIVSRLTDSLDARLASTAVATALVIVALVAVTFTGPNVAVVPVTGASGLVLLTIPGIHPGQVLGIVIWVFVMWCGVKMSMWYVDVVKDLEEARRTEARLAVAEERLRFSADLHDIMGRNLAAISLTAQLADKLLGSDVDRAREQLDRVSELATSSLNDVRGLVRGYRGLDLDAEVRGAVSLLESAGVRVTLTGSMDALTPEQADHSAALIREATTNILHHSDANHVSIDLSSRLIRISNDRAHEPAENATAGGTGLEGLTRRIDSSGTLKHRRDGEHFILELRFAEKS